MKLNAGLDVFNVAIKDQTDVIDTIGEKVYDDEGSHIGWKRGRDLNLKISNTSPLGSIISTTLRLSLRSTKPSSQLLSLG